MTSLMKSLFSHFDTEYFFPVSPDDYKLINVFVTNTSLYYLILYCDSARSMVNSLIINLLKYVKCINYKEKLLFFSKYQICVILYFYTGLAHN